MGSKALKRILPVAGAIVGNVIAPGIGGAIGAGVGTKATGGSWGDALKAGALSYAGGKIGSAVGGSSVGRSLGFGGTVGDAIGSASNVAGPSFMNIPGLSSAIGETAANSVGASIANTGLAEAAGSFAGNALAQSSPKISGPAPFNPKQQDQQDLPESLSAFGSLSPEQQSSNIATQGVYGGGAGPQEQSYFLNLINRRLVDQSGHVDENMSDVNPIENSYLAQLGLGGYGNTRNLLEAISKWKAA